MNNYFVIGCYESPSCNYYPYIANPIVIHKNSSSQKRVLYKIRRPFEVEPVAVVGKGFSSTNEMFPYPSYVLFKEYLNFNKNAMLIILGENKFLYSERKYFLIFKVFSYFKSFRPSVIRCMLDILN